MKLHFLPGIRFGYPSGGGGSGGSGTVTSVAAADTSVVIGGTPTIAPTVRTGTVDVIATQHPAAADWSNNSKKITSVADPTGAQDVSTKNYVDNLVNGLEWRAACRLATAAALPTNVYSNGSSGVGATLTGVALAALTVDGVAVVAGNRILVKNEAAPANNGIYTVTVVGSVGLAYVLTRATDYDTAAEITVGSATFISEGTANTDTQWVMTTTGVIVVGTTGLVFAQFGSGAVSSVFGRTGAVVAATNDYTDAQVNNSPTNKLTTTGDILYASGANTLARLAIGATAGMVLMVVGGLPVWTLPPGYQFDYVEVTSGTPVISANSAATSVDVIVSNAIAYDGATKILIHFWSYDVNNQCIFNLFDGATDLGRLAVISGTAAGSPSIAFRELTPSNATHTYHIKGWRGAASNVTFDVGAGGTDTVLPMFLRISKVS